MITLRVGTIFVLLLTCLSITTTAQSAFTSGSFNWTGINGYQASGIFTYDTTLPYISAEGADHGNFNNGLNYLEINFFDPAHALLYNAVDVQNGTVLYSYLNFNFNPSTKSFEGVFDMGSDTSTPGEYYLSGQIGFDSSITRVADYAQIDVIYENTTLATPEPSTFVLLGAGLGGLVFFRRKART